MFKKVLKSLIAFLLFASYSYADGHGGNQAEKDRMELIKYFKAKFKDPKNDNGRFFPYSTKTELNDVMKGGLEFEDFKLGSYAFNTIGLQTYTEVKEFPPYEELIEQGEELYQSNEALQKCFPDVTIRGGYPYYDDMKGEVVTLTGAINKCLVDAGQKKWNEKKGKMALLKAYFAYETAQAGKNIDVKVDGKGAMEAYERGKEYYYSEKGYLKLSCATCHVQGGGQRVRNEYLSPLPGQVTHFPVYRLKWQGLGTLERRMEGCIKDLGMIPPKTNSREIRELIYFLTYMSNGLPVDGPDIRK